MAAREGGGEEETENEGDPTAVSQPHDREHAHVHRWGRHASAGRDGPVEGSRGETRLAIAMDCFLRTKAALFCESGQQLTEVLILKHFAEYVKSSVTTKHWLLATDLL